MILVISLLLVILLITGVISYLRAKNLKRTVSETIKDSAVLKISVPVNNDKKPLSAEQLFQSLHGTLRGSSKQMNHFSFEIVANFTGIYFIVVCEARYQQFIENQIYAQYPEAQITQIQDYVHTPLTDGQNAQVLKGLELGLKREFFLPIKTYNSFEVDPLASISSAISKLERLSEVYIQLLVRPIADEWQGGGKAFVNARKQMVDADGKKIALESGESDELREIERKNTKSGFQFLIRIIVKAQNDLLVDQSLEDVQASFSQFQSAQFNGLATKKYDFSLTAKLKKIFLGKTLEDNLNILQKYQTRFLPEFSTDIINTEEIASIYHLPNKTVQTPNINWAKSRKLEPPLDLPTSNARFFAQTDYRNVQVTYGVKKEDRRRHMYLLGKTGTGKSTLMKNLVLGDIYDGEGVAVVDPHGDLVEEIMDLIPENRIKDVVYLDPSDMEHPIALNMLDLKPGESIELLADGIVSVFIKLFGHSWGPRLQYLLTNTIITLLLCQNVSLLAVQRILVDRNYRRFLLKQIKDPFILKFWNDEYEALAANPKLIAETLSPIQNKVGRFLSSPLVRNMIGQIKSSIDLQEIMNSGKILLINLSQGKIGEENTSLLGGMIVTRLYTNAMQRANMPETQRRDFYLYVDEFQNFATDTFVKILSEARKYALNLMVTHQYIDQLPSNIQDAIFGNVGTLMNFVVGPKDAARLEKEYTPYLDAEDLVNLERFKLVNKITIDGAQSKPFTATALPPSYPMQSYKEQIKHYSRETYASNRIDVEQKINKWASQTYDDKGNLVQKK